MLDLVDGHRKEERHPKMAIRWAIEQSVHRGEVEHISLTYDENITKANALRFCERLEEHRASQAGAYSKPSAGENAEVCL